MSDASPLEAFAAFNLAIVRVATYTPNEKSRPRLLFGSVSLLTNERLPPKNSDEGDRFLLTQEKQSSIVFRRIALPREEAIAWYRSATPNGLRIPVPLGAPKAGVVRDGQTLTVSDLIDDPRWPTLGVPAGNDLLSGFGGPGDPAPFVGAGATPARIHRRLGDSAGFEPILNDLSAIKFLKRRLHFNVADYSEYLGGLALIVPNPILRNVQHYFVPGTDGASERLVFRLIPRSGQTAEGLQLTVIERRANLLSRFETVSVGGTGLIEMSEQAPVEASGYVVTHPTQGVLVHQPPLYFLRSIRMTTRIVGQGGPSSQHSATIGNEAPVSGKIRVAEAEMRRDRKAQAQRYDQIWVDQSNREAARLQTSSWIYRAQRRVILTAPFKSLPLFTGFLTSFPRTDVPITVVVPGLTRYAAAISNVIELEQARLTDTSPSTRSSINASMSDERERAKDISDAISATKDGGLQDINAVVTSDVRSFPRTVVLVVDEAAWSLDALFNDDIGSSLLMLIPDADPIITRLEGMVKSSISFDAYLARLSLGSSHSGEGS